MKTRCFVDANGHIWSIDDHGKSNFPADIEIVGNTVRILGVSDDLGEGRSIDEEYVLWPSLTALAITLEQNPKDYQSDDGSMSLECAVAEGYKQVSSFEQYWLKSNSEKPDMYPMILPGDNAGLWFEQMREHSEE